MNIRLSDDEIREEYQRLKDLTDDVLTARGHLTAATTFNVLSQYLDFLARLHGIEPSKEK